MLRYIFREIWAAATGRQRVSEAIEPTAEPTGRAKNFNQRAFETHLIRTADRMFSAWLCRWQTFKLLQSYMAAVAASDGGKCLCNWHYNLWKQKILAGSTQQLCFLAGAKPFLPIRAAGRSCYSSASSCWLWDIKCALMQTSCSAVRSVGAS